MTVGGRDCHSAASPSSRRSKVPHYDRPLLFAVSALSQPKANVASAAWAIAKRPVAVVRVREDRSAFRGSGADEMVTSDSVDEHSADSSHGMRVTGTAR